MVNPLRSETIFQTINSTLILTETSEINFSLNQGSKSVTMVNSCQILSILVVRLKCERADIFLLTTDLVSLNNFGIIVSVKYFLQRGILY